jgi:peptide/nickel transport system ATP-binding protein
MSKEAASMRDQLAEDTTSPVLRVDNLSVHFRTARGIVHAVRDISFSLAAGETLAILGESGSGKSVTAAAIMGLIDTPPGVISAGTIAYRGQDLLKLEQRRRRALYGSRLGMVFQDPLAALNPLYTVGWQIGEAFRLHGIASAESRGRTLQLLERVGIPEPTRRIDAYPHQLSGGQRQRVVIAMGIAMRPDVLIADEPTSALDVTVQARILKLLQEIQRENGMGMLLITHDLGVVAEVADRVAVMQRGQIVEAGTVSQVLSQPTHPYTRRLLGSIPGRGPALATADQGRSDLIAKAEGVNKTYSLASPFGGRSKNIVRAVRDVSFELRRGESLGIVGESGSGKSTLARLLLRLEQPTSGRLLFNGTDIATYSSADLFRFRRGVQAVFQDPTASLNPYMTVEQIVSEPWEIHHGVLPKSEWPGRVRELLGKVGLEPAHALRHPHQFSGGQRQRIAIARALALNPDVIVCDEAVSALDVSVQAQVMALLKALRADLGLSYLFIAHDLGVVRDFCDRILVMHDGEIVESGPTEQVFSAPQHPYTRELLGASPMLNPAVSKVLSGTSADLQKHTDPGSA